MKNLPNRLKQLRKCYQLPVLEAEWVCGISRSALNTWERGTRMPSADGLYQIATSYGVSMDWLCGITNTPYTVESIDTAERLHISASLVNDVLSNLSFFPGYQNDKVVTDYIKHKEKFSIEARANILVFVLFLKGLHSFLKKNSGFQLTIQQENRRNNIEASLISVLTTKHHVTLPLYSD